MNNWTDKASTKDSFAARHIGISHDDLPIIFEDMDCSDLDSMIARTIPAVIRTTEPLSLNEGVTEDEMLERCRVLGRKNKVFRSFLGQGYHPTITPSVIKRNILENPGWYTPYTPYQAEIAQGRLEALFNYQTLISELTGLPIANASLLDEASAAAEAMTMLYRHKQGKNGSPTFFVASDCFAQTIDVLEARAEPVGIQLHIDNCENLDFDTMPFFGILIQYPTESGQIREYSDLIAAAHRHLVPVIIAADLMALVLLRSPGELGADVAIGTTQRFGVSMGFGGPHAAFFATKEEYLRSIPGRIIGRSIDRLGHPAYRMALQTREQHIRRDKATSNICTAQALLATMVGMYGVYHGAEGLRGIAMRINKLTGILAENLQKIGFRPSNSAWFDTLKIIVPDKPRMTIRQVSEEMGLNLRYFSDGAIGISINETTTFTDIQQISDIFATAIGHVKISIDQRDISTAPSLDLRLLREDNFLQQPVFRIHRCETGMMRYIKSLERKDLGLDYGMIPLGSCTMKLNPASAMEPITWPEFAGIHPFAPPTQTEGYRSMIGELAQYLKAITGFGAVSFQPNSGAQGEYTGLLCVRAFHRSKGDEKRKIILIPASAHGTNPASAVMAGMEVVTIACDQKGNIDLDDLKKKAAEYVTTLAGLMVTYPSTHGVFEESIREVCQIIHDNGGLVYMDGANMNAMVGLTSPAVIGADLCHINLHKTFAIPHGGGGPGMGPICVKQELAAFLPGHVVGSPENTEKMHAVTAAPWGSAGILPISYMYITMLGRNGLVDASRYAILNANYLKCKMEKHFTVLYRGAKGMVAHEMIVDLRDAKKISGVTPEDVAKRLMDYGFHAPTMSWPVPGTIMIEPTESEPKAELDRFVKAMIAIKAEIEEIASGLADPKDNVLINAPHPIAEIASDTWTHPYSREKAAFPLAESKDNKFWPAVARVDNTYGDRHLICREEIAIGAIPETRS